MVSIDTYVNIEFTYVERVVLTFSMRTNEKARSSESTMKHT